MHSKIVFLLLILFPFSILAQDLREDLSFFEREAKTYQKWLDTSGLGEVLKVRELEVQEKQLTLFLEFHFQDLDSIKVAWKFAKNAFEESHPISLEEQLFYKMVNLMEVRQSVAQVAIYDTYDLKVEPLFFRGIYFEDGKVQVQEAGDKGPAEREITFAGEKVIGGETELAIASFKRACSKENVFAIVQKFAIRHFTTNPCLNRNPQVRVVESDEVLRLRVTDLCRKVLTDAANPVLGKILSRLGYEVNWVKREKLDILVAYEELAQGFKLYVSIDGKYGSGMYSQVGRGGYYSMTIDFEEYLEDYADTFKELLRKEIMSNCR